MTFYLVLDFLLIRMIQVYMLNSSTTIKKYEWSWQDFITKGPQTSKRTILKVCFDLLKLAL